MIPEALRSCFNAIVLNGAIFGIAVSNGITVRRSSYPLHSYSYLNSLHTIIATTDSRKRVDRYLLDTFLDETR